MAQGSIEQKIASPLENFRKKGLWGFGVINDAVGDQTAAFSPWLLVIVSQEFRRETASKVASPRQARF
jgi:hypothetical protein